MYLTGLAAVTLAAALAAAQCPPIDEVAARVRSRLAATPPEAGVRGRSRCPTCTRSSLALLVDDVGRARRRPVPPAASGAALELRVRACFANASAWSAPRRAAAACAAARELHVWARLAGPELAAGEVAPLAPVGRGGGGGGGGCGAWAVRFAAPRARGYALEIVNTWRGGFVDPPPRASLGARRGTLWRPPRRAARSRGSTTGSRAGRSRRAPSRVALAPRELSLRMRVILLLVAQVRLVASRAPSAASNARVPWWHDDPSARVGRVRRVQLSRRRPSPRGAT